MKCNSYRIATQWIHIKKLYICKAFRFKGFFCKIREFGSPTMIDTAAINRYTRTCIYIGKQFSRACAVQTYPTWYYWQILQSSIIIKNSLNNRSKHPWKILVINRHRRAKFKDFGSILFCNISFLQPSCILSVDFICFELI